MRGRVRRGKGGGLQPCSGARPSTVLYGRAVGVTVAGWREMCGPHVARENRLNLTSARLWRTISPYPGLLARFQSEAARARRADLATLVAPTPMTTHLPCKEVEGLESSPGSVL